MLSACATTAGGADTEDGRPLVVATTTILADLVGGVVGADGRVEVLMAPGQDPHGFAPSARQAQRLREADLVVANGLGLEEGARDALEAAEADGVPVLRVAEQVDPLDAGEDADDHEAGHAHVAGDPHVWFDPLRMADGVGLVATAMAEVAPDVEWASRADRVAAGLEATHAEVAEVLAGIPGRCRRLLTNHDNLAYLAARYDLEVVGTVLPGTSTGVDPSARDFAALARVVRDSDLPALFVETTQGTRLAESLAAEVGRDVAIVELYTDALGEPGSGADTYRGMLVTDARRIAEALADC